LKSVPVQFTAIVAPPLTLRSTVRVPVVAELRAAHYDAADPHRLAAFWAQALGYIPEPGYDDPDGASIIDPDGKLPAIDFSRVPEGKTAKNRVHIDLEVAGAPPWDMAARLLRACDTSGPARRCLLAKVLPAMPLPPATD
jgi:Glyoxalase-like domain